MTEETVQYSKDELIPPIFLDFAYFENVLRLSENDKNLKLIEHKIVPGTKPGDHFASIMFKIIVTYTSRGTKVEERSLILKTIPTADGLKKEMLKEAPLFTNEIKMYTKVLPEMERILRNVGENDVLGPRLVYQSMEPPVIILDDVTKQGFEMIYQPIGFDGLKLIIDEIARFHALSLIIDDEKSEELHFESAMINAKAKEGLMMFMGGMTYVVSQMKNWPGFEKIQDKMQGTEEKIIDKIIDVYLPNKAFGFNVLNHGDFHIKNIMFKTTQETIDGVLLLDFQLPFWGTPAIDLAYLIYLIGNEEVRDRKSEVYVLYHRKLCADLEKYGYMKKPPTLLDLNLEIMKYGAAELWLVMCFMPIFYVDFSKIDMAELFELTGDAAMAHTAALYNNPNVVAILKKYLPLFMYKGYLD